MKKRFLIVVGLAKSGTTFLYSECAKRPDVFAMPVGAKEVDYFRRGSDYEEYLRLFDPEGDKVIVDASPLYSDHAELSVRNMKAALDGHDVKIVICLRDPIERAFSHYLHDVAQHQKITGHGNYSFWSPSVIAKYLFPIEPRVRLLQEAFGAKNVFGFAFGADNSAFEAMVRDFANLEADWGFDLSSNPAPGFTSPQTFYDPSLDIEVELSGKRYLLPKGQLLVVNRQFSMLRKSVYPPLAQSIALRQNTLTRHCDTGFLGDLTRERLFADSRLAAQRLGLDLVFDSSARILKSSPSNELPDHVAAQLECLGSCDDVVDGVLSTNLKPTIDSIFDAETRAPSLSREMARLHLAHMGSSKVADTTIEIREQIIETFGPVPLYIEQLMHWYVGRKKYDEALSLFDEYGGPKHLLWPMDLAHYLKAKNIELPEDVAERFKAAGVRIAF